MAMDQRPCVTYGDVETETTWHFDSLAEAITQAAELRSDYGDGEDGEVQGWLIGNDGSATCEFCRKKAHCAEHGHTRHEVPRSRDPYGVLFGGWVHCTVCGERLGDLVEATAEVDDDTDEASRTRQIGDRVIAQREDGRLIEGIVLEIGHKGGESS